MLNIKCPLGGLAGGLFPWQGSWVGTQGAHVARLLAYPQGGVGLGVRPTRHPKGQGWGQVLGASLKPRGREGSAGCLLHRAGPREGDRPWAHGLWKAESQAGRVVSLQSLGGLVAGGSSAGAE